MALRDIIALSSSLTIRSADAGRQGRLRKPYRIRRPGKRADLGNSDECPDLTERYSGDRKPGHHFLPMAQPTFREAELLMGRTITHRLESVDLFV
jgi:hypothetical protein